jgi:F420-0:gamma-glutamyl ligase-like protein
VILKSAQGLLEEDDFLVISETPLAISQGRLVDESTFKPSWKAYILAELWSKYLWGYLLGPLLGIKERTILNLRKLPPEARQHKELILKYYGWKHALKPASEAGVDLSNAPGSYVSLLPENAQDVAVDISAQIKSRTGKNVITLIIDTDATYKWGEMIFTSLPYAIPDIKSDMGIFGYLLGRLGRIMGPTPLGVSESSDIETLFEVCRRAESCQDENGTNFETVHDMKDNFDGDFSDVTVEMLDSLSHIPAVIVRRA